MQKAKQNYFKERTIYYSTFPIREQAEKGGWNYNLKAVYCIGILDFTFADSEREPERGEFLHTVNLKNHNGRLFYHKLTYVYLEMPNFTKRENELATRLDQWLYFIKYLEDFQNIPSMFRDEVFEKAFEKAELANLGLADREKYEMNLKAYRDYKNTIDTAFDEGIIEGITKGKIETVKMMKAEGEPVDKIIRYTGLSANEIERL